MSLTKRDFQPYDSEHFDSEEQERDFYASAEAFWAQPWVKPLPLPATTRLQQQPMKAWSSET